MMPSRSVQLGTLELLVNPASPLPLPPTSDWSALSADLLRRDIWHPSEAERTKARILLSCLEDDGLGFDTKFQSRGSHVIVRAGLVPSDVNGSSWKRTAVKYSERRRYLRELFHLLRRGWDDPEDFLMQRQAEDAFRMSELYASIPSPRPPSFPPPSNAGDVEIYRRLETFEDPDGLRTPMYRYQFRSVGKMLQMEVDPSMLIDPLFTAFDEAGREGKYFVNMTSWDIQRHPGWYDLPRGGILCEQMGVGKTLMCISLILSTLHQPCLPPPHDPNISPIITDHAERSYPFQSYADLRALVYYPQSRVSLERPSLASLCADILCTTDPSAGRIGPLSPTAAPLLERQTLYYQFPPDDSCMREAKRKIMRRQDTKRIYLANTTLVVVPGILVQQWQHEMEKHLIEGALRVRVIGKEDMPDITELIKYDVLLMDVDRFGAEDSVRRMMTGRSDSVLTQARWKRIILDEGHIAGSKTSNAMRLARTLSIERRWIVSGTPTKYLQQGGEAELAALELDSDSDPDPSRSTHTELPILETTRRSDPASWTSKDLDDAARLGVMIGGFLAAEPFKSAATFNKDITWELGKPGGRHAVAARRLKFLMDALMVKHARDVIDAEASLPPSTVSTEVIQFHPMQRITYNVLASLVASNVYTSGFEDQDYFLHPRNTESFNQVIRNLHLACFWYSAHEMGAAECLERTRHHLEKDDLDPVAQGKLEDAVRHLETALQTPGWLEWMTHGVSIPFEASPNDFPQAIRDAWSDSMDTDPSAIDSHSLRLLRDANGRGRTSQELCLLGWESRVPKCEDFVAEMERLGRSEILEERRRMDDKRNGKKGKSKGKDHGKGGITDHETAAQRPTAAPSPGFAVHSPQEAKSKDKGKGKNKNKDKGKAKDVIDLSLNQAEANARLTERRAVDSRPRVLPDTIRTTSRSAKLNFVIDSVMTSEPRDKFVIFGDVFELGHVSEAMQLLDVGTCYVGPGVSPAKRAEALNEFEDPAVRVCLLDLRMAARGLNLVIANRMIFLSPVWSLDLQAQAIKRVHRIGQTRPTKVEILVTEGTFEEDIAKRASSARSDQDEQLYSRALIENPRFVQPENDTHLPFPLRFIPDHERFTTPPPPDFALVPSPRPSSISSADADEHIVTPVSTKMHGAASARVVHFSTEYGNDPSLTISDVASGEGYASGSGSTVLEVGSGEGYASRSGSILKRASGGEGERPKKRARVAFA